MDDVTARDLGTFVRHEAARGEPRALGLVQEFHRRRVKVKPFKRPVPTERPGT